MSIEAMKLALEALEALEDVQEMMNTSQWFNDRVTALRQAIEHAEKPVAWMFQHEETGRMSYVSNDGMHSPESFLNTNPRYKFVCALYTTPPKREWVGLTDEEIAEAVGSPVDEVYLSDFRKVEAKIKERNTMSGYCDDCGNTICICDEIQERQWVGLTPDDRREIFIKHDLRRVSEQIAGVIIDIEAKLKEKNSWQSVANPTEWLDDLRGGADE